MSTVKLRIGPADHGRPMTLEEFREADEEPGYLYELARGVLDVGEVPSDLHGQILDNLHEAFSRFRLLHPKLIRRIAHGSDLRVIIPELDSDRHPDLALVFFGAPLNARGRQMPALVCEIVSPGARSRKRDYEEKAEEYRTVGIQEYWIIDPARKHVKVLSSRIVRGKSTWTERVFIGDEVIESKLLPGLELRVAELWLNS